MKLIKQKIKSHLRKQSNFLHLLLLLSAPFFGLSQHNVSFKNLSEQQVFDKLSDKLDLQFNYNGEILQERKHIFSASGTEKEILEIVGKKLNIKCLPLDDGIYALNSLQEDQNTEEPIIDFEIKDEKGEALPFCNIILPKLDKLFQSDQNGKGIIRGYFSDQEVVQFSYLGYESYFTKVENLKNESTVILKSATHVLGEIIITEFLSNVQSNDLENIESIQEIDIAGISDQDLLKKAQLLPGIHSTSESLNDLQIRGGPPDQVSYKWNDIRLLQTSLFYGKISGVNPFIVDDISITRNGASADQSGQASGSILLEASDEVDNSFGIKIFSDLLYANVGVTIPIIKDKLSAKIAYRRSHNSLFETKIYNDYFDQTFQFGQLVNDQFYIDFFGIRGDESISKRFDFNDLSANINWNPSSKTKISASLINIGNQFQYDYFDGNFTDETKRDQLNLSNVGWSLKGKYAILPQLIFEAASSGSQYENNYLFLRDTSQELDEDRFKENDVVQNQWRADLSYEHQYFDIKLGVQNENWKVSFIDTTRNPSLGLSYIDSERATEEQSAFAKMKWKFIPNTVIETGVRYSDFGLSLIDRKFIEPRIHVSHRLLPKLTIHAHYGKFHQNLNRRLFSTPLEVEKGIWYLSDERPSSDNFIWVVQNTQASIGLKYLINNWKFTLDVYNKLAENIWTSALDFSVEEDPFAFADLSINGLELSSHYQDKNWRILWTYELTDETMDVKQDGGFEIKSPFTQKHKVSLMQSYRLGKAWTFSSRWRFNSGRRFSKGKAFFVETDPELYYGLEYESILEEQISPYHSLDASVQYKWIFNKEKKRSAELGFHIQNVYNRQNIIKRQYYIDYTKTPFEMSYYDRIGLGFTPNVSVKVIL